MSTRFRSWFVPHTLASNNNGVMMQTLVLAACLAEADEACRRPIGSQMISKVQATRSRLNFLASTCRIVQELLLVSYTAHHLSALL